MPKIASPLDPSFAGPVLPLDRVSGVDAAFDTIRSELAEGVGTVWPDPASGVGSVAIDQSYVALAPSGATDPTSGRDVSGERRTYKRTGTATYLDMGDAAAALSRRELGAAGGAGGVGRQDGGNVEQALASVLVEQQFGGLSTPTETVVTFAAAAGAISGRTKVNDTIGAPVLHLTQAEYLLDGRISLPPWMKLRSRRGTMLDFSAMTDWSGGGAVRINNELFPRSATPSGRSAANMSPTLSGGDGTLYIKGPGQDVAGSIGVDVGGTAAGPDATDNRDIHGEKFVISHFHTGLKFRRFDTYLNAYRTFRIEDVRVKLHFEGPTGTNSGERIHFDDFVLGAATSASDDAAILHDVDAFDVTFTNGSVDYCWGGVARLTPNSRYAKLSFWHQHWENANDDGFIKREGGSVNRLFVVMNDHKWVPRTNAVAGRVPVGARPDGKSTARTPYFKGKMAVSMRNVMVGGLERHHREATAGLYMFDADVEIVDLGAVVFNDQQDLHFSRSLLRNYNYNFNYSSGGSDLSTVPTPGWRYYDAVRPTFTTAFDTTRTYDGSAASLMITATNTGSNYYNLISDPVTARPGQSVKAIPVFNGEGTTSAFKVEWWVIVYRKAASRVFNIVSIGSGGSPREVTVTTATAHGLSVHDFVSIMGADQPEYNGEHHIIAVSSTTFKYLCSGSPVSPATGTAMRCVTEPLARISGSAIRSTNAATVYGDTDFAGHTGDRVWWARADDVTPFKLPPGTDCFRVVCGINSLNLGESVRLGQCGIDVVNLT